MLGMGVLAVAVWLLVPNFVVGQEVALAAIAPTPASVVVIATAAPTMNAPTPAATAPVVEPLVVAEPPTATTAPTPTPTATPLPTATFVVMPSPVTDTPVILPTWTPAAAGSNELAIYAGAVATPVDDLSSALKQMSVLLAAPQVGNQEWFNSVVAQIAIIRVSHQRLSAVTPPAQLAGVHQTLIAATQKCSDATYKFAEGYDQMNTSLLQESAQLVIECANGIGIAGQQLEAATGQ